MLMAKFLNVLLLFVIFFSGSCVAVEKSSGTVDYISTKNAEVIIDDSVYYYSHTTKVFEGKIPSILARLVEGKKVEFSYHDRNGKYILKNIYIK